MCSYLTEQSFRYILTGTWRWVCSWIRGYMCSAKFELAKSLITQKLLKEILWELFRSPSDNILLPNFWKERSFTRCNLISRGTSSKKRGVHKIVLWVIKDNIKARTFYEDNGFVNSGKMCIIEGTTKEDCCYEYVLEHKNP